MRADLHTHSLFSFDGDPAATLPAICEAAIAKGITHLAVTDHCDINGEIEGLYAVLNKEAVYQAVNDAKKAYADRLTLFFGVELGQATQYPKEARALLDSYPYDIVLGSLHNLAGERDFCFFDFAPLTDTQISDYFDRVLTESMQLLDFPGIHVLTHLTYMHRYARKAGRDMDFAPFYEKLARLFDKLIAKGVALEINTSTLTEDGSGVSMPTREILSLYRSRGGRLISMGSDAHVPHKIAQHFEQGMRILSECGFTELAVPTARGLLTFPIDR